MNRRVWTNRYNRYSRLDDQVVDIESVGGRLIKNDIEGLVHESENSGHERAELCEAADRGEREIFAVANSAYAGFVEMLAAIAELLELGQTL